MSIKHFHVSQAWHNLRHKTWSLKSFLNEFYSLHFMGVWEFSRLSLAQTFVDMFWRSTSATKKTQLAEISQSIDYSQGFACKIFFRIDSRTIWHSLWRNLLAVPTRLVICYISFLHTSNRIVHSQNTRLFRLLGKRKRGMNTNRGKIELSWKETRKEKRDTGMVPLLFCLEQDCVSTTVLGQFFKNLSKTVG